MDDTPLYTSAVSTDERPPVSGCIKFRKWCFNNGLVYKRNQGKQLVPTTFKKILTKEIENLVKPFEISHLLLNGGCLSVPSDREEEFLKEYIKTIIEDQPNDRLYICEQKTSPVFVMMSEFDLKLAVLPTHEQLMALIKSIQTGINNTLSICKGSSSLSSTVLVYVVDAKKAKSTKINKESTESEICYQAGIHCVWPMLHVGKETAWMLRASVLDQLIKDTSEGNILNPLDGWNETYDHRVFEANGLRMMGSRKAEVCPICKGKPLETFRFSDSKSGGSSSSKITSYFTKGFSSDEATGNSVQICQACQGMGKLDCARPYSYFGAFDALGALDKEIHLRLKSDPIALIKASTIRVTDHNRNIVGELQLSEVLPSEEYAKLQSSVKRYEKEHLYKSKPQKTKGNDSVTNEGEVKTTKFTSEKSEMTNIECNTKLFNLVADYLREECCHDGTPPELRTLKYCISQNNKFLYYATTTCKWCPNKKEEHAHSTNYFIFTVSGCWRKCFSPKRPDQAEIACKIWKLKCPELPLHIRTLLFNTEFRDFEISNGNGNEITDRGKEDDNPLIATLFGDSPKTISKTASPSSRSSNQSGKQEKTISSDYDTRSEWGFTTRTEDNSFSLPSPPPVSQTPQPALSASTSSWRKVLFPESLKKSSSFGGLDPSLSNKSETFANESSNTCGGLTQDFATLNLATLFEVLDYTGGIHIQETEFSQKSTYGGKNGHWKKEPPNKKRKS